MRLLSLSVEHFRCIRKAKLDFDPGLNVLFGPNDLGKSSLAHAMRAALLLQHNAKEHEKFVTWDGSGEPCVELVFESEPQRIWRVRKRFGPTGSSFLDESRNGFDFTNECRGRDVDGRLREILRWGVAPPGKGAAKGMPTSFLSRALFAEQDQVDGIFEHALAADSDETGKKRLSEVLQAMAEDPIFRSVLAKAQERVDEAFNKTGGKKAGKNSPWTRHREAIRQADERHRQSQDELKNTEALESQLQELLDQKLRCQENMNAAENLLQEVEEDLQSQQQRQQIMQQLHECKAQLAKITEELDALAKAERNQLDLAERVITLQNAEESSRAAMHAAAALVKAAEDGLAQLQSEDRARERLLKQRSLETRQADLHAEQEKNQGVLERISAIQAAANKLQSLEREAAELLRSIAGLQTEHDAAVKAVRESEDRQHELDAIAQLFRLNTAKADLAHAEQSLIQINEWREAARQKREEAVALESAMPSFPLPGAAKLNELRRLDNDIQVAAGKLDVGLAIAIHPKRDIRLTVQRDDTQLENHELGNRGLELSARRQIWLDIEGVAELRISGGAEDARRQLDPLQQRWEQEAVPLLKGAGAVTLDQLAQAADETDRKKREMDAARNAAIQLDQRIADQPDWEEIVGERKNQYEAAERLLQGVDCDKLEKAALKLGLRDVPAADKRLQILRVQHHKLISAQNELANRLAGDQGRQTEKQNALEIARKELAQAESQVEGDWRETKPRIAERQQVIARELSDIQAEIASLTEAEDQTVEYAQKALEHRKRELSEAEAAHINATEYLTKAREDRAADEGALKVLRESAAKLDVNAAREAVAQIESELNSHPVVDPPVTEERLIELRNKVEVERSAFKNIHEQIHAKRGALQQVGGDVSRQRYEEAAAQLETAKHREREAEHDYNAWELLRQTLREAEQEESSHLGRLLAGPIASRFSELTSGRYGKLALGPTLETQGISVAGDDRNVSLLSVGTKDQLSTVLRLTIAEQLKSAIVLDDQLTQSDVSRMQWLREFLLRIAANIQVIVLTCRPENYLPNGAGVPGVQLLELVHVIENSLSTPPH